MTRPRAIALGNEMASDDGAAPAAVRPLADEGDMEVVIAGRPGTGLLDLLEPGRPAIVVDVVQNGEPPGTLVELPLERVAEAASELWPVSSHGLGPGQALRLGRALERPLPPGWFVGVTAAQLGPGTTLSPAVAAAVPALREAVRRRARALSGNQGEATCTSTG